MSSEGEKVLILSTKAGAGHLRAAAAIEEVFKETHPEVEVRNTEALEYTNPAFQASFTSAYNKLASDLPSVWGIIYGKMEMKPASSKSKKLAALIDRLNSAPIVRMVRRYAPAAVDDVQLIAVVGRYEKVEKALRAAAAARPGKTEKH
jgi:processive 1,2-diacylglycerol beta-glucosyltransferase